MINKSATHIGKIHWLKTGNILDLWIGDNSNTGETIVWQKVEGKRDTRVTGKNIAKLAQELNVAMNEGDGVWLERNDAALDALKAYL